MPSRAKDPMPELSRCSASLCTAFSAFPDSPERYCSGVAMVGSDQRPKRGTRATSAQRYHCTAVYP